MKKTVVILSLVLALPAHAIVNVEQLHIGIPEPGLEGNIDLSFSATQGNSDYYRLDLAAGSRYHHDNRTEALILQHAIGASFDRRDTNKSFLHLRHIDQVTAGWAWEGFGQLQRDEFARLKIRGLLGGGLRFTVLEKTEKQAFYLGTGAYYSEEQLEPAPSLIEPAFTADWRGNVYLVVKYHFSSQTRLAYTIYYQPALDDVNDYRALQHLSLNIAVAENLDLRLSWDSSEDSRPPLAVKPLDSSLRTGFRWRF